MNKDTAIAALQWHIENGADEALENAPVDATIMPAIPQRKSRTQKQIQTQKKIPPPQETPLLGASDARKESLRRAKEAQTLEELKNSIAAFDGIALKKTASNLVFCDGNPQAQIMLVGEAPAADEDRNGKPFAGASGELLDRILACINLDRKSVYFTNLLNWRPPGNRTPSPSEIDVSLPFIEKHIALVKPKLLIFTGGVTGKALLGTSSSISRLRGQFHDYTPLTKELFDNQPDSIPVLVTYDPPYLLRTPSRKKLVWQDMLMFQQKYKELDH